MAKEELPEGYEIPIHRSLTGTMYWAGVPRNILLAEVITGVFGGLLLKTFIVPILCVLAHFLFRYLGQQDPQFHEVFWRAKNYKSYYYP